MNNKPTTTKKKIGKSDYAIIEKDESGNTVMFCLPLAALYYDHSSVKLSAQDSIDDTNDELIELHYSISET